MSKVKSIMTMVYVAIYLRLSRDDQNGNAESMSIAHQRDMLVEYCEERGWQIYEIYIDDAVIIRPTRKTPLQGVLTDLVLFFSAHTGQI